MFTVGMKGIDEADGPKVEALILETLARLAKEGFDPLTIEAAMNSFEFALRENNTGSFPRGMALMFRTLRGWLHGGDPFEALTYERPLAALKAHLASGKRGFETLIAESVAMQIMEIDQGPGLPPKRVRRPTTGVIGMGTALLFGFDTDFEVTQAHLKGPSVDVTFTAGDRDFQADGTSQDPDDMPRSFVLKNDFYPPRTGVYTIEAFSWGATAKVTFLVIAAGSTRRDPAGPAW